mmetsp:Transcript_55431/g.108514  ORF Transcript_55431/g.108514 Transcript_55431/m.108514 type:complete len:85 (-) Transcript_55431:90-344(-)
MQHEILPREKDIAGGLRRGPARKGEEEHPVALLRISSVSLYSVSQSPRVFTYDERGKRAEGMGRLGAAPKCSQASSLNTESFHW